MRLTTESSIESPKKLPRCGLDTSKPVVAELSLTASVLAGMSKYQASPLPPGPDPSAGDGGAGAVSRVLSAGVVGLGAGAELAPG